MSCARLLLVASAMFAALPARAADPAYVGTWGVNAAQCNVPQERQGAPMVIAARRYDQHEAHCTFTSVKKVGASWQIAAACSVEGDKQKDAFALGVVGDTLTLRRGGSARTYKRCW